MEFKMLLLWMLSAIGHVIAQTTTFGSYTDPVTNITFLGYRSNTMPYQFGLALPYTTTDQTQDLIFQMIGNATIGWSGVSWGGSMPNSLLLVMWPNAAKTDVVYSWRAATSYIDPSIYDGPIPTMSKINVRFNSTHFFATYRCQGCNSWTFASVTGGFSENTDVIVLGWAQSISAIANPADANGVIPTHEPYQGQYGAVPSLAKPASDAIYAAWAALGAPPTSASSTTVPTSTTTISQGTSTATGVEWDYIVVGGGAGGLVTADRLSQAGKSVLLLERGQPSEWVTGGRLGPTWATSNNLTRFDIPGLCNQIWATGGTIGIACEDVDQMAGCVLGGGTAVNAGLFFKPMALDWDTDFPTGWRSTDMAGPTNKLFARIPSTDTPSMDGKRYDQTPFTVMETALKAAGWKDMSPINNSPNSKNRTYAHTPYMYSNGQRGGPMATYLQTAKARSNFNLLLGTMVKRIIRTGGQVTGVETIATYNGGITGTFKLKSTGRLILSAGTFGTAKILFRSGIGPTDQLTVVAAVASEAATYPAQSSWIILPVGYNIRDHCNTDTVISHPSVVQYDWYGAYDNPIPADRDAYIKSRAGHFASAAPGPNGMWWESVYVPGDNRIRQLQWTVRAEGSLGSFGNTTLTMSQYLGTGLTSKGRLTITAALNIVVSTSPFLTNENDIQAVIKGIAHMQAMFGNVTGVTILQPAAGVTAESYVRNYTQLIGARRSNHWIGSAMMGTTDGRSNVGQGGSVVDTNCKVWGTNNLFVVDASVFPGHVATNPSSPIMIMAERAVERILALAVTVPASSTRTSSTRTSSTAIPCSTLYGQCGGVGWTGAKCCASGTCTYQNAYYSQCI